MVTFTNRNGVTLSGNATHNAPFIAAMMEREPFAKRSPGRVRRAARKARIAAKSAI